MSKIDRDNDFSWGIADDAAIDTNAIKAVTDMMKNGIMPLNTLPDQQSSMSYTSKFVKGQIVLAGNLLAINAISPKEWFSLSNLLISEDYETITLAVEIIKAKSNG